MTEASGERYSALESALRLWNARAGSAYQDAAASLAETQRRLAEISDTLLRRRHLKLEQVVARLKADAGEGSPAVIAVRRRVEELEDALTSYHVELQTLEAQSQRTLEAGRTLAEMLATLHGENDEPIRLPPLDAAAASEREDALRAEVELLRHDLERLRHENENLRQRAGAVPTPAQKELARLREEVDELRRERESFEEIQIQSIAPRNSVRDHAHDEQGNRRPLGMILVRAGIISAAQLEDALREQRSAWNRHLGALLVELGYASEEDIAQTLAAQLHLPFERINLDTVEVLAVRCVSAQLAQHHTCVPLRRKGEKLIVAMANPHDLIAQEDLRLATSLEIEPVVATATAIRAALRRVHGFPA